MVYNQGSIPTPNKISQINFHKRCEYLSVKNMKREKTLTFKKMSKIHAIVDVKSRIVSLC